MKTSYLSFNRILITRIDRMGDVLLTTPVFESLRRRFPQAHISVMVAPENQSIVDGNPHINEVLLYDKKKAHRSVLSTLQYALKLRQKKFDVVIHFHSTRRMMWVGWLAGIRHRMGWKRHLAWLLTEAFDDVKKRGEKHEAQYNFDLLKDFNISAPSVLKPYFPLKEKDEMLLRQKVGKLLDSQLIVIHAGASCPSKRWPAERFGEVARFFQQKYGFQVVLVGGEETKPFSEQITHCLSSSINLTAQLSLGELAQLLKKSVFLLSNDSGPVHMASAVEKPVVSIFGRKEAGLSPTRWRPLGEKSFYVWKDVGCELCLAHQCQINFLCLTEISAQEVIQTIEEKILKSKTVSI